MTRRELKNALPQTPDHFILRMDKTLKEIEHMNAAKPSGFRSMKTVLIAAALILALTGAAVAVGSATGIFDHLSRSVEHLSPLEGAQELLDTSGGTAVTDQARIEIVETLYADATCKVTVDIHPAEGVTFMFPELKLLNAEYENESLSEILSEDGSASYMLSALLTGEQPDALECEISVPLYKGGEVLDPVVLPLTLTHVHGDVAMLAPQGVGERWSIQSASIARNDFSMTLDVKYLYQPLPGEDMGVDIIAFDAQGNRIAAGEETMTDEVLADGTVLYRQIIELQSAESLPETLILQPKVIGEDLWLDAIECSVE